MFKQIKSWFSSKKEEIESPTDISIIDLTINDLQVGDILDYDGKSFEVTKQFGDSEFQLKAGDGTTWYLEREEDDEVEWSISEKIEPTDFIHEDTLRQFKNQDDDETRIRTLTREGIEYTYDEEDDDELDGEEFYYWEYEGPDNTFITLEEWEDGFEAVLGRTVQEFEFDNILRRKA